MAKKRKAAGSTRAVRILEEAGVPFHAFEYEHSDTARSFGLEAARQIGGDPHRIYKTLLVHCDEEEYLVAVIPVDAHLSLKRMAKAADKKKAEIAEPHVAERRTGYVVGGISPLGQTTSHRTFLDLSAVDQETILVSGGKRGLSVEVKPADLVELTGAEIADLQVL